MTATGLRLPPPSPSFAIKPRLRLPAILPTPRECAPAPSPTLIVPVLQFPVPCSQPQLRRRKRKNILLKATTPLDMIVSISTLMILPTLQQISDNHRISPKDSRPLITSPPTVHVLSPSAFLMIPCVPSSVAQPLAMPTL